MMAKAKGIVAYRSSDGLRSNSRRNKPKYKCIKVIKKKARKITSNGIQISI